MSFQKGGKDFSSELYREKNQYRNTAQMVYLHIKRWTVCICKQVTFGNTQMRDAVAQNYFNDLIIYFSTGYCVVEPTNLGQFGVYNLTVDGDGCRIQTSIEPVNTNLCKKMIAIAQVKSKDISNPEETSFFSYSRSIAPCFVDIFYFENIQCGFCKIFRRRNCQFVIRSVE